MTTDQTRHLTMVDGWLLQSRKPDEASDVVALFDPAFKAVWERARPTLSEVTLAAVAERALGNTRNRFPALAAIVVTDSGFSFQELKAEPTLEANAVQEGLRSLLVEFLTILGALSGQILTPALHAAVAESGPGPAREDKKEQ